MGLGDLIERGLRAVGVTEERVTSFLGRPCGCKARKRKLNLLSDIAAKALAGNIAGAKQDMEVLLNGTPQETGAKTVEVSGSPPIVADVPAMVSHSAGSTPESSSSASG